MYYVANSNTYTVWFALCKSHLSLYAEHSVGGKVGKVNFDFIEDNYDDFMEAYKDSIDWAKSYLE